MFGCLLPVRHGMCCACVATSVTRAVCSVAVTSKQEIKCAAFCPECSANPQKMQEGYLSLLAELNEISERRSRLMVAHARFHQLSRFVLRFHCCGMRPPMRE